MDFSYPQAAEAFRAEVRAWLERNLPDDVRGLTVGMSLDRQSLDRIVRWTRMLAEAGYAAIAWPREFGGRDASLLEQLVLAEEMDRARAPGHINILGLANIAPAIMRWGTEEQKRFFLPRMLTAEHIWCQGFSEPGAGSDLASLRTRAVRDGDHFVVNGQKVWTSLGHVATHCQLLVRTDPEAPKHRGITCLLIEMSLPGIEVRPLTTITGEREFNEVFFTGVRVPVSAVLGPVNEGWKVALTTLAFERAGVLSFHLEVARRVRDLWALARGSLRVGRPASEDPVVRQRLARVSAQGELLRLLAYRAVSAGMHGRPPGPEGSLGKLVWSELAGQIADVAGVILGPEGTHGEWAVAALSARGMTIAGGTTEIQKNIIAERILGLPRGA